MSYFGPPDDLQEWATQQLVYQDQEIARLRATIEEEQAEADTYQQHLAVMADPDGDPLMKAWLITEDYVGESDFRTRGYTWEKKLEYARAGRDHARHKLAKANALKATIQKALKP